MAENDENMPILENKNDKNTCLLDGEIPDDEILEMAIQMEENVTQTYTVGGPPAVSTSVQQNNNFDLCVPQILNAPWPAGGITMNNCSVTINISK